MASLDLAVQEVLDHLATCRKIGGLVSKRTRVSNPLKAGGRARGQGARRRTTKRERREGGGRRTRADLPVIRMVWYNVGKSRVEKNVSANPNGSMSGIQPVPGHWRQQRAISLGF
jgi:hypothetical protein